jgi:hypothetical protein
MTTIAASKIATIGPSIGTTLPSAGGLDPILDPNNPNLVLFTTMDNISGATLVDDSPSGNNGTITGATAVSGKIGNALTFPGALDRVNFGNILNSVFAGAGKKFSISLWCLNSAAAASETIISKYGDGSTGDNDRQWILRYDASDKISFVWFNNGQSQFRTATTDAIQTSASYKHIVITFDNDVQTNNGLDAVDFYMDSVLVSATITGTDGAGVSNPMTAAAARLALGAVIGTATGTDANITPLSGDIDQVRIFDRILTQSEIDALFNSGAGA